MDFVKNVIKSINKLNKKPCHVFMSLSSNFNYLLIIFNVIMLIYYVKHLF